MAQKNSILKFLVKDKKKAGECSKETSLSQFTEEKINGQLSEQKSNKYNDLISESKGADDLEKELVAEKEKNEVLLAVKKELAAEKEKNQVLLADLRMSMALIKDASAINLNKDIKIENLTKQLKRTSIESKPLLKFDAKTSVDQTLFSEFDDVFSKEQLKKLRSISSGKKKDSTFVLACMRYLYPDTNILKDRSVTGRSFKKEKKREMTPTKVKIIRRILNERLNSEKDLDESESFQRLDRAKKLMKDAIMKLKKSKPVPFGIEPTDTSELSTTVQPIAMKPSNPTTIIPQSIFPYAYHPFGHNIPTYFMDQSTQYASLPNCGQVIDWTKFNYQLMPGSTIYELQKESKE